MAAYHRANGKYPDKLGAIVPKYLPQSPQDIFTGSAPVYRHEANGYLLYRIGVNMKDDGGQTKDDAPAGDDLVVRMPR